MKIVVEEIEKRVISCSSSLPHARTGGVSFFQSFGSKLNYHPHFHLVFADGVFINNHDGLSFCQALITPDDIQDTEDEIRKRVLKLFGRKKWIEKNETEQMLQWENSGFSLNASVKVQAWDKEALERLLRYCSRPPFASENLRWNRDMLVYRLSKVSQDGISSIQLSPLEFFDRVTALIPPPRSHLQHYHGVFAPNAPFRKQITAHANKLMEEHIPEVIQNGVEAAKIQKEKSSYSWAKLLARIYEVFPLVCTCGQAMKIIAFITNPHTARQILNSLKFNTNPFDPIAFEPKEWENSSQLVPETLNEFTSKCNFEQEYEMSQLVPGTEDGFADSYDAPLWMDSS